MTIPSAHRRAHPSARRGSATPRTGRGRRGRGTGARAIGRRRVWPPFASASAEPATTATLHSSLGPPAVTTTTTLRQCSAHRRVHRVRLRRNRFFFFFVLVPSCARLHFLPVHYYRLFLFSVGVSFIFFFVTANIIPVDTLYLIVRSFPRCFSRIEFSSHATAPTVHHHQTR